MRFIILLMLTLFLCNCTTQDTYDVQRFEYFSDDEVHVYILKHGQTEQIICAFPPNTDYQHLKRVKIGAVKNPTMLEGVQYYCTPIIVIPKPQTK